MKNRFLKALGRIAFLTMLAATFTQFEAKAQDLKQDAASKTAGSDVDSLWGNGARGLEGTWEVQTTILDCQTGTVQENFSKLISFNFAGTVGEVSSSTPRRTTSFGIWEHNSGDLFRYLLRFFRFNADGTPAGSVRARWDVALDGPSNSYTAIATVHVIAPDGTVVATRCGTETATRLIFPD